MKKTLAIIALAGAAVFTLTGCGNNPTQTEAGEYIPGAGTQPSAVGEFTYITEDGREVFCIYATQYERTTAGTGGPSCDWANAVQK